MSVIAIIPSAGRGKRMKMEKHKQILKLHDKPILAHTLEKFQNCPSVDEIIVVSAVEIKGDVEKIVESYSFTKVTGIVEGGKERQDSVYNGIRSRKFNDDDIILIHDAVRPFISCEKICEVVDSCKKFGAVILAVRPEDTVKLSSDGSFVDETVDRSKLLLVQTPQAFRFDILYSAYMRAYEDNFYGTDDSALVERLGVKVKVIEGERKNIKITTPFDLKLAVAILNLEAE